MALTALPEYNALRKRLQQNIRAQQQREQRDVKRHFARVGGTGGGAFLKQMQETGERAHQRQRAGEQDIRAAESAEQRRIKEIKEGREFASGEAEKQREYGRSERVEGQKFESQLKKDLMAAQQSFMSGEAEKGREFGRGERIAGQQYASGEAEKQRAWQSEEAKELRSFQKQMENERLRFQYLSFGWQKWIQKQQLDLQRDIAEFNKNIAIAELNKPTDLFSSIFGSLFSRPERLAKRT